MTGSRAGRIAMAAVAVWVLAPLLLLLAWSFTRTWRYPALLPQSWTRQQWLELVSGPDTAGALATSAMIGLVVALLATAIGLAAGRALAWYRVPARGLVELRAATPTITGLHLDLPAGTITALIGPSGCGKSTLLSIIAGLLPAQGRIAVDGTDISGVPAERRDAGMVFQRPMLFPHLDVLDNVAFGLRRRGIGKRAARKRAAELLGLVELPGLGARRTDELSGGQAQRVALARALAPEPRILLLDEPLSALDPAIRERMRELIRHVQRELRVTTLFVTHDQAEASEVADQIALMLGGRIAQAGTASGLHLRPNSAEVALFLGKPALVEGRNADGVFHGPLGPVRVPPEAPDGDVRLVVAGSAIVVDRHGGITARVTDVRDVGTSLRLRLHTQDGIELSTDVRPATAIPAVGCEVGLTLDPELLWTVPASTSAVRPDAALAPVAD